MTIITQTPHLIIREFLPEEESLFLNHFSDPEVCLYIPKRTLEERRTIFNKALAAYEATKQSGTWGIYDSITGDFIGSCLLRPYSDGPDKMELGYSLERIYWNKGLGAEMAKAMVTYALANEGTNGVVAVTTLQNAASMRVLEKAGLQRMEDFTRDGDKLAFFSIEKR